MKNKLRVVGNIVFHLIVLMLVLMSFSLVWAENNYGHIGFEEIVFHLNMPLQGTAESILISYTEKSLIPTIIVYAVWLFLSFCPIKEIFLLEIKTRKKKLVMQLFPLQLATRVCYVILVSWITLLIISADISFGFCDYVMNQIHQSKLVEREYVDPQAIEIVFPEKKRNLIVVYIESAETTAQDEENGGVFEDNYIPEMTKIAKENVSFSRTELIDGAYVAPGGGWTIAALVSQTSGLPLKLLSYTNESIDNGMGDYEYFMPGATTLGDILEEEGYHNFFMAGSQFEFGGRKNYFTQHGHYEIWDYLTAKEENKIPEDYNVWWGFEDEKLYAFAKEKLIELAAEEQPFNFSMLTVDTHHQDGYVCELCDDKWDEQYANVWSCASAQLNDFVEWLKQQQFYENTTVVIAGDHYSMDTDFYEKLYSGEYIGRYTGNEARGVYNAFLNSVITPVQEKNRMFTTMDLFPTILASIGAEIEGNRIGLGTNLFSAERTLAEEYGYETLCEELSRKSIFYEREILFP